MSEEFSSWPQEEEMGIGDWWFPAVGYKDLTWQIRKCAIFLQQLSDIGPDKAYQIYWLVSSSDSLGQE